MDDVPDARDEAKVILVLKDVLVLSVFCHNYCTTAYMSDVQLQPPKDERSTIFKRMVAFVLLRERLM